MDLSARYELRAPTPDDADAVAHVLADAGQTVLDADFLRDEWSRVGFDLATDAWVVADGEGTIVAYGQALRDEPSIVEGWGVVHPKHRGRGIGASLMNRIEERAPELVAGPPSVRFRHAIDAGDRAAAAMLRARGLRPVRHFWHMRIDLSERSSWARRRRGSRSLRSRSPTISRSFTRSSTRPSPTTGAIIRSRSIAGSRSRRRARAMTRRSGCWRRLEAGRLAPSPRTSGATAAG
jgi:GNAT superfamily N-acetyltransferase